MTAQEAQTLLQIEPPFSAVELKSAHKNALVTWLPAQFMNDRVQLGKALEQTARIHEAYDVLRSLCEQEPDETANPWVEEAMKLAYGKGGDKSSPSLVPESGTPVAWDPLPSEKPDAAKVESSADADLNAPDAPPLGEVLQVPVPVHSTEPEIKREPVEKAAAIPAAPIETPPASYEVGAVLSTPATDATSAAVPNPSPAGAEHPRETGRVPAAWRTETTHATKPTTITQSAVVPEPFEEPPWEKGWIADIEADTPTSPPAGSSASAANPFLHEIGPLKVVPLKPVDIPKVELREAAPAQWRTPTPAPAPLATAPVSLPAAPASPDAGKEGTVAPRVDAAITQVRPPKVVISPRLRRTPILSPPPVPPEPEPMPVPVPAVVPVSSHVAELPAAEPPVVVDLPVEKPKPVARETSAAHAEEASAAVQASHHAPTPVASTVTPAASAPPVVAKPVSVLGITAPADASATVASDVELAGDHALVPVLGDRYHPAEKESSPHTDSSRHLPTRPFAPSGMTDREIAKVAAAERVSHSPQPAQTTGRTLTVWQRLLRFLLAIVCVSGVAYGIYWTSQSKFGKDPWGMEPGSGGPGDRVRQLAFESLTRAAERGNADAQMKVARAYQQGKEVKENPEEALKWFRKAADQGNVDAQYAVGDAYKNGTGVPQDNAEALKWYRMAEENRERQKPKVEEKEDIRLK